MSKRSADGTERLREDCEAMRTVDGARDLFGRIYGHETLNLMHGLDVINEQHAAIIREVLRLRPLQTVYDAIEQRNVASFKVVMRRVKECDLTLTLKSACYLARMRVIRIEPSVTFAMTHSRLSETGDDDDVLFVSSYDKGAFAIANTFRVSGFKLSFYIQNFTIASLHEDVIAANNAALATGIHPDIANIVAQFILPWANPLQLTQ